MSAASEDSDGSDRPPSRSDPWALLAFEAGRGERTAVARLLEGIAPSIARTVRALLGPGAPDFDDALQESLLGLVDALPAFRGESGLAHYATRIAVRTTLGMRRRNRLRAERDEDLERGTPREIFSPSPSPSEEAMATRRRELLRALLDELPEIQAETLAMRVVLDYSSEEVAEATGANANTVRSRLRLAKDALRKRIEGDAVLSQMLEVIR